VVETVWEGLRARPTKRISGRSSCAWVAELVSKNPEKIGRDRFLSERLSFDNFSNLKARVHGLPRSVRAGPWRPSRHKGSTLTGKSAANNEETITSIVHLNIDIPESPGTRHTHPIRNPQPRERLSFGTTQNNGQAKHGTRDLRKR